MSSQVEHVDWCAVTLCSHLLESHWKLIQNSCRAGVTSAKDDWEGSPTWQFKSLNPAPNKVKDITFPCAWYTYIITIKKSSTFYLLTESFHPQVICKARRPNITQWLLWLHCLVPKEPEAPYHKIFSCLSTLHLYTISSSIVHSPYSVVSCAHRRVLIALFLMQVKYINKVVLQTRDHFCNLHASNQQSQ